MENSIDTTPISQSPEARDLTQRVGEERASVCVFIAETFACRASDLNDIERGLAH